MKPGFVRTSIDLSDDLYRRLRETAARRGCSARQLIVSSIERAVEESRLARPVRRLDLKQPIVKTRGKPLHLTNEQIYDILGLP